MEGSVRLWTLAEAVVLIVPTQVKEVIEIWVSRDGRGSLSRMLTAQLCYALYMGNEQMTIDLWTKLTGRQRVLQFHLGNVPMMNLSWSELDEGQR